jgi:hypothetical protein
VVVNNVIISTKIRVNGRDYESIDAMPADIRHAYERALAAAQASPAASSGTLTPGIPATSKITFNGQTYSSVDEMPAAARGLYEQIMAAVEGNRNGIPDLLEGAPGAAARAGEGMDAERMRPLRASPPGMYTVKVESTSRLAVATVIIAGLLLVWSLLGR